MRLLALESPQAGMSALPGAALNRNLSWKVGAPCVSTLRGLWKEILWLWGHVSLPSNHNSRLSSDLWSQPTQRESHGPSPASSFLVGESKLVAFYPGLAQDTFAVSLGADSNHCQQSGRLG